MTTTEPKSDNKPTKPTVTAVGFVQAIRIDNRDYSVVIPSNREYEHLSLSESPGFVLVVSTKNPNKIIKVPLANVKFIEASRVG